MGVLTQRLHGSITALAAMAALSLSSDSPDESGLRSLSCSTGQNLLLSPVCTANASSSLVADTCLLNSPSMGPGPLWQPPPRSAVHEVPCSPFASQSSSLCFHKALSTTKPASQRYMLPTAIMPFHKVHYGVSLLPSPSMLTTAMPAQISSSNSMGPVRCMHWKSPFMAQLSHARTTANHSMAADFLLPRLPPMAQLEKLISSVSGRHTFPPIASASLLHMRKFPVDISESGGGGKQTIKPQRSVAVVLLGWLGAEQKHLKKYVDWYTAQGIHAVTFVVPMKDLLTLKAGDRAEKHVDILTQNLVQWLKDVKESDERIVVFHTFSNTGWLIYGAVLERLISRGDDLSKRIKGCVVDSAPSARPDPHVWASGFSTALLKKGSVATRMLQPCAAEDQNGVVPYPKPSLKEAALLAMLEKFFSVFLQIPYVNRRLNDVVSVLANHQPPCPQLYIYSSADAVIPAKSVESFIEEQKKAGQMVKACDFQFSPHVDHFRTFPERYIEQLTNFLKLCVS